MLKERIEKLEKAIETYRQAILDAEGALDSAEKELDQLLNEEMSAAVPYPAEEPEPEKE